MKSLTNKIKIMIAYRTTIARCLVLAAIVGYSTLTCRGGTYQDFKGALANDDADAVERVMRTGGIAVDSSIGWWYQRTPLHIAAREGAVNIVKHLIERCEDEGIDIAELKDKDGATPLHLAALYQRQEVVAMLMRVDENLAQNPDKEQPLATVQDRQKYMALHRAIQKHVPEQAGHVQGEVETDRDRLVRCLLPENLSKDTVDEIVAARVEVRHILGTLYLYEDGYAPIHLAAENGTLRAALYILEQGEDMLDNPGKSRCTPLHLAVKGKQSEIAIKLLNKGAKICHQDVQNRTLLHYITACPCTAQKVIEALEESVLKELLSLPDNNGRTPLHQAVIDGHLKVVKLLVAKGADVSVQDNSGCTPLDLSRNKIRIRDHLLRNQAAFTSPFQRLGNRLRNFRNSGRKVIRNLSPNVQNLVFNCSPSNPSCSVTLPHPCNLLEQILCCVVCCGDDGAKSNNDNNTPHQPSSTSPVSQAPSSSGTTSHQPSSTSPVSQAPSSPGTTQSRSAGNESGQSKGKSPVVPVSVESPELQTIQESSV